MTVITKLDELSEAQDTLNELTDNLTIKLSNICLDPVDVDPNFLGVKGLPVPTATATATDRPSEISMLITRATNRTNEISDKLVALMKKVDL